MQVEKCNRGGGNLLVSFYREYLNDNPELFWVADDEDKGIVGFCMGYYMDKDDQMENFMKHNRFKVLWKTLLLMLSSNKQTWNKMLARFKHKPSQSDWTIVNDKNEHILTQLLPFELFSKKFCLNISELGLEIV